MSDPAWLSRDTYALADGVLFIRAAGASGAPASTDEIGFVTNYSDSHEPQTSEQAYLNVASKQTALSGYAHSGSFTLRLAEGADAERNLVRNAVVNRTLLKIDIQIGGATTGQRDTYDYCIIGFSTSGEEDGWTMEVTFTARTWATVNATDPA